MTFHFPAYKHKSFFFLSNFFPKDYITKLVIFLQLSKEPICQQRSYCLYLIEIAVFSCILKLVKNSNNQNFCFSLKLKLKKFFKGLVLVENCLVLSESCMLFEDLLNEVSKLSKIVLYVNRVNDKPKNDEKTLKWVNFWYSCWVP